MGTALLHNRVLRLESGFPDYSFSGASAVVDTGAESGTWKIALTGSGTLTLNAKSKVTIQAQGGGGGGGASNGSTVGNDGYDGSIQTLENKMLDAGDYAITIGAAGARGNSSAGYAGGNTVFADLLTANGGAGGARAGGNRSQTHSSIYGSYGKGGLGGANSDYTGSLTYTYSTSLNLSGYTYIRTTPNHYGATNGTISSGTTIYLTSSQRYPCERGDSGCYFYKLADGRGYIDAGDCRSVSTSSSDTRRWYGTAGTAGVILLSGKA